MAQLVNNLALALPWLWFSCGKSSVPDLGTSACCTHSQKTNKKSLRSPTWPSIIVQNHSFPEKKKKKASAALFLEFIKLVKKITTCWKLGSAQLGSHCLQPRGKKSPWQHGHQPSSGEDTYFDFHVALQLDVSKFCLKLPFCKEVITNVIMGNTFFRWWGYIAD